MTLQTPLVQKYCYNCDTMDYVSSEQHACATCGSPLREAKEIHGDRIEQLPDDRLLVGRVPPKKAAI